MQHNYSNSDVTWWIINVRVLGINGNSGFYINDNSIFIRKCSINAVIGMELIPQELMEAMD